MSYPIVNQAARNNALWCDAVCSAHGRPGEFHESLWINRLGPPRHYPDVVTLTGAGDSAAQTLAISALCETSPGRAWAVKDSFQSLDLAPLGFAPLFEAQWLCAPPEAPRAADQRLQWRRIGDEPALLDWERSWSDEPAETGARIFMPRLLADPDICFLIAGAGGGILNRGADVVGVSNVFASDGYLAAIWDGLAQSARSTFPGLPIVAYEHGNEMLEAACRAGFSPVGPLRIWSRAPREPN